MAVTAVSFKTFFPEYAGESDAFVEFRIAEAMRKVDDSWLPADVDLATLYLAAHYVTVSVQQRESGTGQVVTSERFGPMSISYGSAQQPGSYSDLSSTTYGERFLELVTLNFPAVAVV